MSVQPFLIADTRIGVERDIEPWLLPNDAYPDLQDCYIWRGRIHKRKGYQFLGRLQSNVGPIASGTTISFTLINIPLTPGLSSFTIGSVKFMDNGAGAFLQTDGGVSSTINYSTGAVTLVLAVAVGGSTPVFYYPGLPVMGLRNLQTLTENEDNLIGFDTRFSYLFSNGIFNDLNFYKISGQEFVWHGANFNLFWTTNYLRAMFATNEIPGIDGATYTTLTAGATTTIVINGVNATANFVVNDFVFIYPNTTTTTFPPLGTVTEFQGSGQITSSTFGAGNTTIVVAVATTNNSGTGTIFNASRSIGNGATIGDGIKWLDQDKSGWVNFQPPLNGSGSSTNYLQGATMIFAYKGRLIMLNTQEGSFSGTVNNFYQRARWSQAATVYYSTPTPSNYTGGVDPQAWRDDVVGKGGFIDAATLEQIVSAEFVKDTLIVYFENSTWQLRWNGNELLPFVWEKINTELGAQSTFSAVPFDKNTIAFGNVGIHACNSVDVERIDSKIPDEIFNVQGANQGPQRVFGIRDYFYQLVYWTMPYAGVNTEQGGGSSVSFTFPNKILVYNYIDSSFSFFNDSFTCFGYYQQTNPITWGNETVLWGNFDTLWSDPLVDNAFVVNTVGGNQQGFVEVLMQQSSNDQSLFISNISGSTITCPNHNLQPGQFVKVLNASGITSGVGVIYKVVSITDANNFVVNAPLIGTFTGNGLLAIRNNISILTKRFNPFIQQGEQVRLVKSDFYIDRTTNGQFTINLYIDEDSTTPINADPAIFISTVSAQIANISAANPCVVTLQAAMNIAVNDVILILGVNGMTQVNGLSSFVAAINGLNITLALDSSAFSAYLNGGTIFNISKNESNVINTFPETTYQTNPDKTLSNSKLWKRVYFEDISQLFQYQITYNDIQMICEPIVSEDIVLHGVLMWFSKSGRLINV